MEFQSSVRAMLRPHTAPPATNSVTAHIDEDSNFKVCVRIRPESTKEKMGNHRTVVQPLDQNVLVFDPKQDASPDFNSAAGSVRKNPRVLEKRARDIKFAFDRVFDDNSSQQDVFEYTAKHLLNSVLDGINASVFAYGATGAGKTHTMLGALGCPGVMVQTVEELYRRIKDRENEQLCEVAVSYIEVYNETVRDLLNPKGSLAVRDDSNQGVCISGLGLFKPRDAIELLKLLEEGNANRTQHPTDANATSSRSHAVFTVYLHQKPRTADVSAEVRVAKMCLIDLAGSERATVTTNQGMRMREGANINRSLLALGNCINALASGHAVKASHIPYRDSKLTRILKDSLGGNTRTVMIANVSPSSMSFEDTYNTLNYANRAKNIKTTVVRNVVNVDFHVTRYKQIVTELRSEIDQLKAKLLQMERCGSGGVADETLVRDRVMAPVRAKMATVFGDRLTIRREMASLESSIAQAEGTSQRIQRDLARVRMLEVLGDGAVPRLNVRVHMLNKEQQAVKDMLQGFRVRMEGHRYRLNENEDDGLEILQMISNPQLTQAEQAVLSQEYHFGGERIEKEYLQIKEQENIHLVHLMEKEKTNVEKMAVTMMELLMLKYQRDKSDEFAWMQDAFKAVVECGKETAWRESMSPIKPASPTKHKLDETFEGSPARVERTVDPVPERHAPATPLLNAFTANIARSSSNDSGSTSSPIKSLSFQTATELSPIVSGALPSDDDTVNLYIKMTSKGKDVKPRVTFRVESPLKDLNARATTASKKPADPLGSSLKAKTQGLGLVSQSTSSMPVRPKENKPIAMNESLKKPTIARPATAAVGVATGRAAKAKTGGWM